LSTPPAPGAERPQLAQALDHLRSGDTLVVWRLDRLERSLRDRIDVVTTLKQRASASAASTSESTTTSPGGRLTFHLFGALAEFERDLIRERSLAGLAAARARGRNGGRPTLMTPAKIARARELYAQADLTVVEIAKALGVSRASIYGHLPLEEGSAAGEAVTVS
jgi:DNA invertase Pin-like site-specific DNA recombinase